MKSIISRGIHDFWMGIILFLGMIMSINFPTNAGDSSWTYSELIPDLYHSGAGTTLDPYVITNWNHLDNVRQNLSAHFKLNANLDQNTEGYTGIGDNWTPIGDNNSQFTGSFDGAGHVISNLTISSPTNDNVGLFGFTKGTSSSDRVTISNLGLVGATVTGRNQVGALVGQAFNTTINNASASGSVNGSGSVGGLIGIAESVNIARSYAVGDVTGTGSNVGGLVGRSFSSNGMITESYATGNVEGDLYVGGLVGNLQNPSISNSYAIGNVDGRDDVGGLVGRSHFSNITNSYATGVATGTTVNVGGLVGFRTVETTTTISNSYWNNDASHSATNGFGIGKTLAEMYDAATYTGWNTSIWSFFEGRGAAVEGYEVAQGLPYLTNVTREQDRVGDISTLFDGGWGGQTEQDQTGADGTAYTITNTIQLQNINLVANSGFDFELSNNIDLSGVAWTPIGSSFNNKFSGVFDGNGRTISNLEINSTGVGIGLFGWTDGATIKNVGLIDFNVKGEEFVGGLVGLLENSRVYQSYSAGGNVTAINQFVGGLVGRADLSEIEQSYSTGNVGNETNKGEKSGGLVGALFLNSSVKQSYASGNVIGSISVGGLVGFAIGTIEQSYANGAVEGNERVGGLVGLLDTGHSIIESYATGKVIGNSDVGGLVGLNDGSVATSYFDKTINPDITDEENFGKTTDELQSLTTFEEPWDIVADPTALKGYPRLTHFVDWIDSHVWVIGTKEITLTGTYQGFSGIDNAIILILSEAIDATEVYVGSTEIIGFTQDGANITITVPKDKAVGEHDIRIVTALGDLIYPAAYTSSDDVGVLFAGGDGTSGNPYQIEDWTQLQNMTLVLDGGFHFILNNDLTPQTTGYTEQVKNGEVLANGGAGWIPISHTAIDTPTRFALDGNNKTIQGLEMDRASNYTGLFGQLTGGDDVDIVDRYVNIKDLTITDAIVRSRQDYTGILIGYIDASAQLHRIHVQGSINIRSNKDRTGGMIGRIQVVDGNEGNLSFLSADVTFTAGRDEVGGLIGDIEFRDNANSKLTDSWASGNVSGREHIGGLIGRDRSYGEHGLVIKRCYATGDVTSTATNGTGGLIGRLRGGGKVFESYATGNIQGPDKVGGLVGETTSIILDEETGITVGAEVHNSYATGNVRATNTDSKATGGLVGDVWSNARVINSYALGTVTIDGDTHLGGGLLGKTNVGVVVTNSFWNTTANPTLQGVGGEIFAMPTDPEGLFGKTTTEMKFLATFTSELDPDGWDFENVWAINPTGWISYPYLKSLDYDSPGETPENNPIPGLEQRLENTIEFAQLQDVVYGIVPFDAGATATSGDQVAYTSSNTDVADIENNLIVIKGVGETTITATLVNVFGYSDAIPVSQELKVLPKSISIEGIVVENKFYDGTAIASILGTANLEGVVGKDEVALSGEPVFTFEQVNAGENINVLVTGWTLTGKSAINYTLKLPSLTGTIDKASLTITVDDKQKTYGEENPALTFSYTGLVNGDTQVSTEPSINTTATASSGVGTYPIALTGGSDDNYDITLVAGEIEVTKATLTITADNKSKVYGEANPALTFIYTGLVNGDENAATEPNISTTATASSNVGTYPINLTGAADANYDITLVDSELEITKAGVTITAENKSKVYGEANPSLTFTYTGLVNGDTKVATEPSIATTATASSNVGTYPITLTGTADANYDITLVDSELEITKAGVTITATDKTKVYGEANPSLTFTYTGLVNGDTKVATEPSVATTATASSNVGTYPINLTGAADANYDITLNAGELEVTKATLTITADNKSKVYGQEIPALTFTYSGFVNGDTKSATEPSIATTATAGSNVGTYPITLTGAADANYDIALKAGELDVTKATLTITADNKSKVYGEANPALTFTYTGFVNGDEKVATEPSIETTATAGSNVGTYPITLTGAADANYDIALKAGELEVTKATLTITADEGQSKIFGTADQVLSYSATGFAAGDDEQVLTGNLTRDTGEALGSYPINLGNVLAGGNYQIVFTSAGFEIIPALIEAVMQPAPIETVWGVYPELPSTVTVITTDGQFLALPITWDLQSLYVFGNGEYPLSATITLPTGILNTEALTVEIVVIVLPKPSPEDILLDNNSFEAEAGQNFIAVGNLTVIDPIDNQHDISLEDLAFDNGYFQINNGTLFWNSEERADGRTTFKILVRVQDRDGNILEKEFTVIRNRTSVSNIEIFNSFTPNGDNVNDTWGVEELRFYKGVRVQVFERSGKRLFYTENPDIRWDGTFNGKELPIGTYYWTIEVGETGEVRKGMLNLLRK